MKKIVTIFDESPAIVYGERSQFGIGYDDLLPEEVEKIINHFYPVILEPGDGYINVYSGSPKLETSTALQIARGAGLYNPATRTVLPVN